MDYNADLAATVLANGQTYDEAYANYLNARSDYRTNPGAATLAAYDAATRVLVAA